MRRDLICKPIGHISSPYKQKFGTPRQSGLAPSARATIQLDPQFIPAGSLEGLKHWSHIWLLFHFHKNRNETLHGKTRPPRLNGEKIGFLATRTPHRPNPIGMSLVQLLDVDELNNTLNISGADVVDGTPVIDIKPYISDYDSPAHCIQGWTQSVEDTTLSVSWSDQALQLIKDFHLKNSFQNLVNESLQRDIRDDESRKKKGESEFKVNLDNIDVVFTVNDSDQRVNILTLEKKTLD
jgi:tRNA-Thr(GGU) m(6)t(6)A37 methyltransferase TsaA